MNRHSQRGIALIITLIMLAVVTVMAVLFLGISRRERGAVTVSADFTDAKLAADMALARAEAAVLSQIAAQSNLFAYDLTVSTNFIAPKGFQPGISSLTNVGYTYQNGTPLRSDADIRQNLTNLFYDPRPPVYVPTGAGLTEFRYYLDLDRNRRFDTNGISVGRERNGQVVTNLFVGDPEWIGILQHPDRPHSSSNKFVARFAFLVVPAGKTLDINYIHNAVKNNNLTTDGFRRNLGAGSWELNLAAFFRDLNPYWWTPAMYSYQSNASPSSGAAFADALSVLQYRYRNNWFSQKAASDPLVLGSVNLATSQLDLYSNGPLVTGSALPAAGSIVTADAGPWAGSDNTNGFVSVQELFDTNKVSPNMVSFRLLRAINNGGVSLYDQNTFSRLMAQMGTDSLPANEVMLNGKRTAKLNLNYKNKLGASGELLPELAAGLQPWDAIGFFTNAARLMLQQQFGDRYTPNGTIEIPVWNSGGNTNTYTAGVHRLLQLAANMWDSTTNRSINGTVYPYFPTVFRPVFAKHGSTNISIVGYVEEAGTNFIANKSWRDLNLLADRNALQPDDNVFGVPLVIGSKKGFPNFNEFYQQTSVQVTRRLQGRKDTDTDKTFHLDVSYEVGISNYFGLEAWNSYTSNYPRALQLVVTNRCYYSLADNVGPLPQRSLQVRTQTFSTFAPGPATEWKGGEFVQPLSSLYIYLPDSFYNPVTRQFVTSTNIWWDRLETFVPPDWKLYVTNRVQYFLLDTASGRVVDFVNLDNLVTAIDVSKELIGRNGGLGSDAQGDLGAIFWLTNRATTSWLKKGNPSVGVTNQIWASAQPGFLDDDQWRSYSLNPIEGDEKKKAIDMARVFLNLPPVFYPSNPPTPGRNLQFPFTPTRKLELRLSWQANDPLVHYHIGDLYDRQLTDTNNVQRLRLSAEVTREPSNLKQLNTRYRPWGQVAQRSELNLDLARQDPMIRSSDDWNFPTNQYPGVGWLGRVHRGTPWQTMYLKSTVEPPLEWVQWSGSHETRPTNDWWLLDLFTTAPNENAARGLLSVNQTNTAAWSAVLSGVAVLSNSLPNSAVTVSKGTTIPVYTPIFIEPASPQLLTIVSNINVSRPYPPGALDPSAIRSFPTMGNVLAAPALTVNSPFLNFQNADQAHYAIRDEVYERIPQQILSLLKDDEPYVVIYAYGQSLKPADNSLVRAAGVYQGLCTNYQITGEYVTKTAVRFEETKGKPKPNLYRAVVESYNVLPPE